MSEIILIKSTAEYITQEDIQKAYDEWLTEHINKENSKAGLTQEERECDPRIHPNELWHRYEMKWKNGEWFV